MQRTKNLEFNYYLRGEINAVYLRTFRCVLRVFSVSLWFPCILGIENHSEHREDTEVRRG